MQDILYDAAIMYEKLRDVVYKIVVGRKGKSYSIMLHFPPESFFHLAGLQHLTDITFPSKNKERIGILHIRALMQIIYVRIRLILILCTYF